MCYHKSVKVNLDDLTEHYNASFDSIHAELEPYKDKLYSLMQKDESLASFTLEDQNQIFDRLIAYSRKDALPSFYNKEELSDMKRSLKALTGFDSFGLKRYHENGFDFLPSPIITAGSPDEFKLFNWGLIPFFMTDPDKAMVLRTQTLNCISEEMYEKPSFRDAIKNGQRCLIPFKGCFEWRWLDDKGTIKIPYFIDFEDGQLRSMAGVYSRWKDPRTSQYYYSYSVLTTRANPMFEIIHNSKFRMPVFLRKEDEQAYLQKNLSKHDVLDLCSPSLERGMRAHTISKC